MNEYFQEKPLDTRVQHEVSCEGRTLGKEVRLAKFRVRQKAWAVGGFVSFALGAMGAVLPLLPTMPFLLVAAFCFARSSTRLNAWFRSTKLYRSVLEGYVARRAMTLRAKMVLLIPLTVVLGISFALMENVLAGRIVVAAVWVAHVVYFGFVVETARDNASCLAVDAESGR